MRAGRNNPAGESSKKGEDRQASISSVEKFEKPKNSVHVTRVAREDVPRLRERWLVHIADLTGPIPERLPPMRDVNHRITLIDDNRPLKGRFPKCPDDLREQLREKMDRYIRAGWWEERNVPYASPLLCIYKKTGLLRTVVDTRERNLNTVRDLTPFPDQDMIRNDVARAKFRSKLDMTDAYEQIRIEPEDVWKTAFATIFGTMVSHTMQIGDCNGLSTCQRLMTRLFFRHIGRFVHVYLDDIFIFSRSIEEHEDHLQIVFDVLRKAELFLSAKKVDLYSTKMDCLGHMIDDQGIHVGVDKMALIRAWPVPRNYNEVQRFVGLVNYVSQFMPDISAYTSPLMGMSSQLTYRWNPFHQKCFDSIKVMATKSPILKPIDPSEVNDRNKIFLVCDASPYGIGAYYGQGEDWRTCRPAGFLSKKFSNAQMSYRTYEQETLAILEGLMKWEDKLLGRPVHIMTDHKALEFFQSQGHLSNRQVRWWEYFSRFNATINYIEGKQNRVADALSRYYDGSSNESPFPMDDLVTVDQRLDPEGDDLPLGRFIEVKAARVRPLREQTEQRVQESEELRAHAPPPPLVDVPDDDQAEPADEMSVWEAGSPDTPIKIILGGADVFGIIKAGYAEDTVFGKVMDNITEYPAYKIHQGILYVKNPIGKAVACVPSSLHRGRRLTELVIDQAHQTVGHLGYRKVFDYARKWFWWPSMSKDIDAFCKSCGTCQTTKDSVLRPAGLLHTLPIPTRPWSSVAMDFMGPLPESDGMDYLMVVICRLSSMVHLIPTTTTATANGIAWLWLSEVVKLHGLPDSIVSDRDSKFMSKFWTELHRLLGIKLLRSTAYHPQTDGASERAVRTVSQILRAVVDADQLNWRWKCPMTEFAMNSAVNATTNFAPFEVNYGWLPTMFPEVDLSETHFKGVRQFAEQALQNIDAVHDAIIANRVFQTYHANKRRREDPVLKEGDLVYLSTANLNLPKGRARKLLPKFIGPYPIDKARPETSTYQLRLPPELVNRRIHPNFHVSKLRPHIGNDDEKFPHREVITYYDFGEDPQTEWMVDAIVGHRWNRNQVQFHVRWSLGDTTWESLARCDELQALDNYLELHGAKEPSELPRKG